MGDQAEKDQFLLPRVSKAVFISRRDEDDVSLAYLLFLSLTKNYTFPA